LSAQAVVNLIPHVIIIVKIIAILFIFLIMAIPFTSSIMIIPNNALKYTTVDSDGGLPSIAEDVE
jgi:hypothetical protein